MFDPDDQSPKTAEDIGKEDEGFQDYLTRLETSLTTHSSGDPRGMAVRFVQPFTLVETHSSGFGINADGSAWVERDGNRQEISAEDRDALGSAVFGGIYDLIRPKDKP